MKIRFIINKNAIFIYIKNKLTYLNFLRYDVIT